MVRLVLPTDAEPVMDHAAPRSRQIPRAPADWLGASAGRRTHLPNVLRPARQKFVPRCVCQKSGAAAHGRLTASLWSGGATEFPRYVRWQGRSCFSFFMIPISLVSTVLRPAEKGAHVHSRKFGMVPLELILFSLTDNFTVRSKIFSRRYNFKFDADSILSSGIQSPYFKLNHNISQFFNAENHLNSKFRAQAGLAISWNYIVTYAPQRNFQRKNNFLSVNLVL